MQTGKQIAILGAGMCGLAAARHLEGTPARTVIFEKSRSVGGRVATRRTEAFAFDHGAPNLQSEDETFRDVLRCSGAVETSDGWVGVPAMNDIAKSARGAMQIAAQHEIVKADFDNGWRLTDASGIVHGPFDVLLSTIPAPQALRLFGTIGDVATELSTVRMSAQWTLLAGWNHRIPIPSPEDGGFFDSVLNMADRPGRSADSTALVAHAPAGWSEHHLDVSKDEMAGSLFSELQRQSGGLPASDHLAAHRWRYCRTTQPLGRSLLAAVDGTLLLGGDWALGNRAEHAFQSGIALAEAAGAALPSGAKAG